MSALEPIPWQLHLFLTPSTLARLERASSFYGANLHLYDNEYTVLSPGWRSYAQQAEAYRRYRAGTGPVASSPDSGQRNHMRGAAFDLRNQTARAQAACRLAGLVRDSIEPWHWNDPNAANMPIIPTRTNTAAVAAPAPLVEEEDTMQIIAAISSDVIGTNSVSANEWAVIDGGFTRISNEDISAIANARGTTAETLKGRVARVTGRSFLLTENIYKRMN